MVKGIFVSFFLWCCIESTFANDAIAFFRHITASIQPLGARRWDSSVGVFVMVNFLSVFRKMHIRVHNASAAFGTIRIEGTIGSIWRSIFAHLCETFKMLTIFVVFEGL